MGGWACTAPVIGAAFRQFDGGAHKLSSVRQLGLGTFTGLARTSNIRAATAVPTRQPGFRETEGQTL